VQTHIAEAIANYISGAAKAGVAGNYIYADCNFNLCQARLADRLAGVPLAPPRGAVIAFVGQALRVDFSTQV
jgi:hypothetical protein